MLIPNTITAEYLAEISSRQVQAAELVDLAHRAIDLAATSYAGRCLTRPVFLDRAELAVLSEDLIQLHAALTGAPDRLFGGDLAGFARAVGMTEPQVTAIMRGSGQAPTRLCRADIYRDSVSYQVMEVNMGSTVGGLDNALLNEAFLTHPVVADFVADRNLAHVDTMGAMADTLRAECEIPAGESPLIVAADWPESYLDLEDQLRYSAEQLAGYGLEVHACHLGQLSVRDGHVWLEGQARPVDVIYRVFLIEDLLAPQAAELIDPVLRAVERGEVKLFTPLDAELYGSKGVLALVSDEANRRHYSDAELASLDRILPWTRMMRPGPVTVAGEQVDIMEYAIAERADLVLKPTALHSGIGVVLGWLAEPAEWRSRLTAALQQPYVLQRRIRPLTEPFPAEGGLEPWVLGWGAFLTAAGYGGAIVRGSTDPDIAVMNMPGGATATCCFHAQP